jgi:O-6-methylguanine DNA methyltransferase
MKTTAGSNADAHYDGIDGIDAAFASGHEPVSNFADTAKLASLESPCQASRAEVIRIAQIETPLGPMVAGDYLGKLCLLEFEDSQALEKEIKDLERIHGVPSNSGRTPVHEELERQLSEYFEGKRERFDVDLEMQGTDFQLAVWKGLLEIPFGETRSYRDLARAIGRPEAVRAVARANGGNRIAIVVPCHRVIGSDGSLTGYSGGLPRKNALLQLEKRQTRLVAQPD